MYIFLFQSSLEKGLERSGLGFELGVLRKAVAQGVLVGVAGRHDGDAAAGWLGLLEGHKVLVVGGDEVGACQVGKCGEHGIGNVCLEGALDGANEGEKKNKVRFFWFLLVFQRTMRDW